MKGHFVSVVENADASPVACEPSNTCCSPETQRLLTFVLLSKCGRKTARRDEEVDEIRIDRRLLLEPTVDSGRRQSTDLWCLLHLQIARL